MRLGHALGLAGFACIAASVAGVALADIAKFNAAVKAGDYKTAAVEAKSAWASWDRADPDTALIAREFGFVSYMAGDYAAARDFGLFLKNEGARLAKPDDQPATSGVLLAAANFRLAVNEGTRRALHEALKSREGKPGIDYTTVLAVEALYKGDYAKGAWSDANDTAGLAWRLLERAGAQVTLRTLDARSAAATAGFLAGPDKQDYDAIVDAHDAVVKEINATTDARKRMSYAPLKYNLEAWATSVRAYFHAGEQIGSSIPIRVKDRDLADIEGSVFPDAALADHQCKKAEVVWPKIHYPASALAGNVVGTVIMKMDTDGNGRVVGWETLAAVPSRHFGETLEAAMDNVYWKRTSQDPTNCSLEAKSRVVRFWFGRL